MSLSTERCVEAITRHSRGLAEAAGGHLDAPVEHCPGWSVSDLVWHVAEVHWFWGTISGELLDAPPDESRRRARTPDKELVAEFLVGAAALADTLRAADQAARCWTWFPPKQDVAFITRHQVQEAAVHHWDAAHAAGAAFSMDQDIAVDCIEEFLTCSLADAEDVSQMGRTLLGPLTLHATDTGQSWTVLQATPEAELTWTAGGEAPTVSGTAEELILWLYDRVSLPSADDAVVAAFRGLYSTD